jgi:hypothetical protein
MGLAAGRISGQNACDGQSDWKHTQMNALTLSFFSRGDSFFFAEPSALHTPSLK